MEYVAKYFNLSVKEVEKIGESALEEFQRIWDSKPRNTEEEIRDAYNSTNIMIFRHAWYNRDRDFGFFTKLIKSGDSILDYGSGVGKVLEPFIGRKDVEITLADIKSPLFDFVKWKYGDTAEYIEIGLDNKPLKDKYNHIICLDVLEHIPNPLPVFMHLTEHLKSKGYLLITYSSKADHTSHLKSAVDVRDNVYEEIKRKFDYIALHYGYEVYRLKN